MENSVLNKIKNTPLGRRIIPAFGHKARKFINDHFPDELAMQKKSDDDIASRQNRIIAQNARAALAEVEDYKALAEKLLKPYNGKIEGVKIDKGVMTGIMDAAGTSFGQGFQNYAVSMLQAGMQLSQNGGGGFLGYPYLATLLLRSEYQRVCQKWAEQCVRKGIILSRQDDQDDEKEDRINFVYKELKRLNWQKAAHEVIFGDRAFGGYHTLLVVTKKGDDTEDLDSLKDGITSKFYKKDYRIKCLRNVEPFWVYPDTQSNFNDPAAADFYEPQVWQVNGRIFHKSALLTLIGMPVPDIYKPAFFYRGFAITQLIAPYVDRYLNNVQAAADLLKSFSVLVLKTNMAETLNDAGYLALKERVEMLTQFRDNRNINVLNSTEALELLSTPLTGIPEFVSQSLEQVATAAGLTIMAFTSQQPGGLNATGEGETRTMYETIDSYREYAVRPWLSDIIKTIELLEYGNSVIDFEFENLHEPTRKEELEIQEIKARIDDSYVGNGIISESEVRDRIRSDDDSIYAGIPLDGDAPEKDDNFMSGLDIPEENPLELRNTENEEGK